jgi:hypothetical protein
VVTTLANQAPHLTFCWSHARRKFYDVQVSQFEWAVESMAGYCHTPCMSPPRLRLFQSESDPDLFGYALDEVGCALPTALGPWKFCSGVPPVHITLGHITVIKRDGFMLMDRSSTVINFTKPH